MDGLQPTQDTKEAVGNATLQSNPLDVATLRQNKRGVRFPLLLSIYFTQLGQALTSLTICWPYPPTSSYHAQTHLRFLSSHSQCSPIGEGFLWKGILGMPLGGFGGCGGSPLLKGWWCVRVSTTTRLHGVPGFCCLLQI